MAEIGQAILDAMGSRARIVPFSGPPQGLKGWTPWSVPSPVIADTSAAEALGYQAVIDYAASAPETCRALLAEAERRGWRDAFPGLSSYPEAMFEGA